jgi:hypothetical protein
MAPIGSRREIIATLRSLNTGPQADPAESLARANRTANSSESSPNGFPESDPIGDDILFGPGIEIELPPGIEPVTQMLLKISDDDIGWDVVRAIAHRTHWKLLDPMSGRELRL